MSSNNQLIILKNKKVKRFPFEVHHNLCVDNDFEPSKDTILKKFKTLVGAIKYANEYCNEYSYVEYSYHICGSCLEEE